MSIFGDAAPHVGNAPEPGNIPDATYRAYVFDVGGVKPTKDGSKQGLTITYKIAEGDYEGEVVREWKEVPQVPAGTTPSVEQNKKFGYLRQRFASLGVPAERMATVEADDLVGKKVLVTVKNNNGYVNVNRVSLDEGDTLADGSSPFGL